MNLNKLSVHHICSFIVEKQLSGHSYSVPALCESINEIIDTHLHVTEPNNLVFKPSFHLHEYKANKILKPILSSKKFKNGLKNIIKDGDIIHNHCLWRMPNIYPLSVKKNKNIKIIISPRGSFNNEALRISKVKKYIFSNFFGQNELLNKCDSFHATSIKEKDEIRSLGYKQPIAIIPNGIDIPILPKEKFSTNKTKFLFLGRLHPIKGLDFLIDSWANINENDIQLEICGHYEDINYYESLKKKVKVKNIKNIIFSGPVSGEQKSKKFLQNDVFILPSKSENFGLVIAEALSYGLPVITSDNTPWKDLENNQIGWVTKLDQENLNHKINLASKLSKSTLKEMGLNGREFIKRKYSWGKLSKKYDKYYKWLSTGVSKPEFVDLF